MCVYTHTCTWVDIGMCVLPWQCGNPRTTRYHKCFGDWTQILSSHQESLPTKISYHQQISIMK